MSAIHLLYHGLQASLDPIAPPGVHLSYFTAPSHAPEAIVDTITANQTATFCYQTLVESGALEQYDGFLVSCFSDHPVTHMLREHLARFAASGDSNKPVINIFEASISHALLLGNRFAIITTGKGMKDPLIAATNAFLGCTKSERFVGVLTTGLGVVELREGDPSTVRNQMMKVAADAARLGADVLILGCAGMAGMEGIVKKAVRVAGLEGVHAVDGARAGVELLVGLIRTSRAQS